jgi:hypothetical protein
VTRRWIEPLDLGVEGVEPWLLHGSEEGSDWSFFLGRFGEPLVRSEPSPSLVPSFLEIHQFHFNKQALLMISYT